MNGINRRGQKVRCIAGFYIETCNGDVLPPACPLTPQVGETYTVDGFLLTGIVVDRGTVTKHGPGIVLREINSPTCDCCSNLMGWPIVAFRPLDERKTDISTLVEAGNRTDLLTPDDKLAEFMRPFEAKPTKVEQ